MNERERYNAVCVGLQNATEQMALNLRNHYPKIRLYATVSQQSMRDL